MKKYIANSGTVYYNFSETIEEIEEYDRKINWYKYISPTNDKEIIRELKKRFKYRIEESERIIGNSDYRERTWDKYRGQKNILERMEIFLENMENEIRENNTQDFRLKAMGY